MLSPSPALGVVSVDIKFAPVTDSVVPPVLAEFVSWILVMRALSYVNRLGREPATPATIWMYGIPAPGDALKHVICESLVHDTVEQKVDPMIAVFDRSDPPKSVPEIVMDA